MALPKLIAPLSELVSIVVVPAEERVAAMGTATEFAVIFPPIVAELPLEIVNAPKEVVPPTAWLRVIAPVPAANVKALLPATAPLMVLSNVRAPELVMVAEAAKIPTALFKVIGPAFVRAASRAIGKEPVPLPAVPVRLRVEEVPADQAFTTATP
jgi:hypothetical protein